MRDYSSIMLGLLVNVYLMMLKKKAVMLVMLLAAELLNLNILLD